MTSKFSPSWPDLGQSWRHFVFHKAGFRWGLALGAHKPAKIAQHKLNFSPDSLKILIPTYFCHFLASKCSPSWPNLGQSCGNFGLQNAGFSWGVALAVQGPAKISQHKVNFSPDSLKILIPSQLPRGTFSGSLHCVVPFPHAWSLLSPLFSLDVFC